jgi:Leucine-rich repeat (LRR) protein
MSITCILSDNSKYSYKSFDNIPFNMIDNIIVLSCENSKLNNIPFFPNLEQLYCANNKLTSLPKFKKLRILFCNNNCFKRVFINDLVFESHELQCYHPPSNNALAT